MSLDKSITNGRERRRRYRGSKAVDKSCRNHGGGRKYPCAYCENNRLFKNKRQRLRYT